MKVYLQHFYIFWFFYLSRMIFLGAIWVFFLEIHSDGTALLAIYPDIRGFI